VAEAPVREVVSAEDQFESHSVKPRLAGRSGSHQEEEVVEAELVLASEPYPFTVTVLRDPDGQLKGGYRAQCTARGLQLTKKQGKPFCIPVGTPVTNLSRNRLGLTLDGRRIEVRVTKLAAYQNRLARDVSAFLRGEGGLDPQGYRIEWYLLVPALLPLGIPVLTLGGALPAVFGVALSGCCFAIAQKERWPLAVRLLGSLGVSAAGYGVVIALVVGTMLMQGAWPWAVKQADNPQQAANGDVAPAAEPVLAVGAAPEAPLRSRAGDIVYRLSYPRDLTDELGRHTLTVDYEKMPGGTYDGGVLMVRADNGQRLAILYFGAVTQPRGTLKSIGPFGTFGQLQFPKNLEFYLTRSDTRYGLPNPTFKVSNSVTLGTMPNLTLAREWTAQEKARFDQPPPNYANANAHPDVGSDTPFAGAAQGGGAFRYVEPGGLLLGVDYRLGEWEGEKCLGGLVPIFGRSQPSSQNTQRVLAQEGYAVGALKVQSKRFVDAVQIVFQRVKPNGRLDPNDSYTSDWLGFAEANAKARTLGGEGRRVIGIHCRQGAILDGIALVLEAGN
jgi:hypothetical protein